MHLSLCLNTPFLFATLFIQTVQKWQKNIYRFEPTSDSTPNEIKHRKAETLFHILVDPVGSNTFAK